MFLLTTMIALGVHLDLDAHEHSRIARYDDAARKVVNVEPKEGWLVSAKSAKAPFNAAAKKPAPKVKEPFNKAASPKKDGNGGGGGGAGKGGGGGGKGGGTGNPQLTPPGPKFKPPSI